MPGGEPTEATVLLNAWQAGDQEAGRRLMSEVYQQLRRIAGACLRNEGDASSLQPTALVNELYLAMFSHQPLSCESRIHFLRIAARQMRNIVIDDARRRKNLKRGGAAQKLSLDESFDHAIPVDARLADLDDAMQRLEKLDERSAKVVELRFFGGLTEQEIADAIGISTATVKRDWEFARAWLLAQMEPAAGGGR
ncbi:MAG TPA: sigma-70 family RNA polymerase sigma factor [Bryobacteraceae bacterium]|nr:sigma-70 family RNA polymerase sigma factor [Bryobacteraceae bacterium]